MLGWTPGPVGAGRDRQEAGGGREDGGQVDERALEEDRQRRQIQLQPLLRLQLARGVEHGRVDDVAAARDRTRVQHAYGGDADDLVGRRLGEHQPWVGRSDGVDIPEVTVCVGDEELARRLVQSSRMIAVVALGERQVGPCWRSADVLVSVRVGPVVAADVTEVTAVPASLTPMITLSPAAASAVPVPVACTTAAPPAMAAIVPARRSRARRPSTSPSVWSASVGSWFLRMLNSPPWGLLRDER